MKSLLAEFDLLLSVNYKIIHETLETAFTLDYSDNDINYPQQYLELISWHNGQNVDMGDLGLFAHGSLLSHARSKKLRSELLHIAETDIVMKNEREMWFNADMLPLTEDACGNSLCVNLKDEKLYQYTHDDQLAHSGYDTIKQLIESHFLAYKDRTIKITGMLINYPGHLHKTYA